MKKFAISALSYALPAVAFAQTSVGNVWDIASFIKRILDTALPLLIAAAVVWFVYGLFQLFLAADEEKKEKAKSTVIYGVIAIFVMVSVWGLVNILVGTFNLNNQTQRLPDLPQVPR
jgi:hypothetical protein